MALIEKSKDPKAEKVRRFALVKLPPRYAYLRQSHD
jgi:hypothetical protein